MNNGTANTDLHDIDAEIVLAIRLINEVSRLRKELSLNRLVLQAYLFIVGVSVVLFVFELLKLGKFL